MGSNSENNPDLRNLKRNLLSAAWECGPRCFPLEFWDTQGKVDTNGSCSVKSVLSQGFWGIQKKCNYVFTDLSTVLLLSMGPCSLNQAFT